MQTAVNTGSQECRKDDSLTSSGVTKDGGPMHILSLCLAEHRTEDVERDQGCVGGGREEHVASGRCWRTARRSPT
jgi:hypothetical protein